MLDWVKKLIASRYAQGAIRAVLAAFSGWLLKIGVDADTVNAFIGPASDLILSLIMLAVTIGWSWKDKKDSAPAAPEILSADRE